MTPLSTLDHTIHTHLLLLFFFFFFNDTATTEIYTLSLHDALPISQLLGQAFNVAIRERRLSMAPFVPHLSEVGNERQRSEEHTSELQSPCNLVCRLLLEKKKYHTIRDE